MIDALFWFGLSVMAAGVFVGTVVVEGLALHRDETQSKLLCLEVAGWGLGLVGLATALEVILR